MPIGKGGTFEPDFRGVAKLFGIKKPVFNRHGLFDVYRTARSKL